MKTKKYNSISIFMIKLPLWSLFIIFIVTFIYLIQRLKTRSVVTLSLVCFFASSKCQDHTISNIHTNKVSRLRFFQTVWSTIWLRKIFQALLCPSQIFQWKLICTANLHCLSYKISNRLQFNSSLLFSENSLKLCCIDISKIEVPRDVRNSKGRRHDKFRKEWSQH